MQKNAEKFREFLLENGYSQSSISTYLKSVEKFQLFLRFYGFEEKKFDSEKLISFLSSSYKTRRSISTAISGISRYLSFLLKRRVKIDVGSFQEGEFREFREISKEMFQELLLKVGIRRKTDIKVSLYIMLFLGLKPAEIERLGSFRLSYIDKIPAIFETGIKRLIVDTELVEIFRESEDKNSGLISLNIKRKSLKVIFFRIVGKPFSIIDFRENYAYRLIKRGLPVDIVVEFSGVPLDRVSYLYRVFTLKSKQEIIGEKLTDS